MIHEHHNAKSRRFDSIREQYEVTWADTNQQRRRQHQEVGWQQPIVVDENDVVVIGHCRLLAAKQLGLEEVPITVASGLTENEIRELRIADNKSNESPWDWGALEEELADLDFSDFDFDFEHESSPENDDERETKLDENYQIIIDCTDEVDLQRKYDLIQGVGIECRISTL